MRVRRRFGNQVWLILVAMLCVGAMGQRPASAEQLFQLKNGMVLRGNMAQIATLKEGFGAAMAVESNIRPIWFIDDGLRRMYLHGRGMIDGEPVNVADPSGAIELWQPKPLGGQGVEGLGSILGVSPFTEFGRRQLVMRGPKGPVNVVQGITELNSRYAKLIAIESKPTLLWDMRVATKSLDSQTLKRIFNRRIGPDDLDGRLGAVRFFREAGRFEDAKEMLLSIENLPADLNRDALLVALTEDQGAQLLGEVKQRLEVGQYKLAREVLSQFPVGGLGRISRIEVQDVLAELQRDEAEVTATVDQLRDHVSQLDPALAEKLAGIVDEIAAGLSLDTIVRLNDYVRLGNSATMAIDDRVALAVTGWLMGGGAGEQNLSVAIALIQVRDLVAEYLGTPDAGRRRAILDELRVLEGAQPEYVDRMLPLLLPPLDWPEGSADETIAGMYAVDTDRCRYAIQLPPEYNPLRTYPCVLALHDAGSYASDQLDFWAGSYNPQSQSRHGHAAREGFIVVAPVWSRDRQGSYEYTPAEHERVLAALRDAMRRASIDSDRVFIAGHGDGATAAWDIALSHPDIWAGMISINGTPSKTVNHYEANSRYVPMYLLMGEKDADRTDGSIMDDYMTFRHDVLVVMYRGRGREPFFDERPQMFQWMSSPAHVRRDPPREFETSTMRAGDQFFWWLELGQLKPDVQMDPILWDQASRPRSGKVTASIGSENLIRVGGPADQFKLTLRPQPGINLSQEITVRLGSRSHRFQYDGSLETMLEDARRRADRRRAFWFEAIVP